MVIFQLFYLVQRFLTRKLNQHVQGPLGHTRGRLRHLKLVHLPHESDVSGQEHPGSGAGPLSVLYTMVEDTGTGCACTGNGDKCSFISPSTEKCMKTNVLA